MTTMREVRAPHRALMAESELDELIRVECKRLGLLAYHTRDSRRSSRGFPDWSIAGPHGVLFRECKGERRDGTLGKVQPEQRLWLAALSANGDDAGLWLPDDWRSGRIMDELVAAARGSA